MFYKVTCLTGLFICIWFYSSAQDSTMTRIKRSTLSKEHYEKGVSFFNQNAYESAIVEFQKSTTLDPFNHLAYYFNGLSFERLDDLQKALYNYNLSLAAKEDFNEALFSRAMVYYKLTKFEMAINDLEILLTLPPGETQSIYFRGIHYGAGDENTGFDQIISMNKKDADTYNYLGLCYYHLGRYNESSEYFIKAIEQNPEDDNIHVNAGLNYMAHGKMDSARIQFMRSLEINPHNDIAAFNLSLLQPDSTANQINQLDKLIENNQDFPMAYAQRAYQQYLAGNYPEAIDDYSKAIELDPGNPEYYLERGMIFEKIEALDKAVSDFEAALRYDDANFQIWYNLANAHFLMENYLSSVEAYSRAIDLESGKPELYYNRAIAHFYIKEMDKACEDMNKAKVLGMTSTNRFLSKYCQ